MEYLIAVASFVLAIWFMVNKKSKVLEIDQQGLTVDEKIVVWLTCFLAPIVNGFIFYYGWKKVLPTKAKQAYNISWIAFSIVVIVGVIFSWNFLVGTFNYLSGKQPVSQDSQVIRNSQPYELISNQDTSGWVTYTSQDGYSFKYPPEKVEIKKDLDSIKGFISSKDLSNQINMEFTFGNVSSDKLLQALQAVIFKEKTIQVQNIILGAIYGKVVTSDAGQMFIFSVSPESSVTFNVLSGSSLDIPFSIISTLSLIK